MWIRSSMATAGLPSRDKRHPQRDQRLRIRGLYCVGPVPPHHQRKRFGDWTISSPEHLQGGRDLGLYGAVASSDSMPAMCVVVTTRHGQVRGSVADGGECLSGGALCHATFPCRSAPAAPPSGTLERGA